MCVLLAAVLGLGACGRDPTGPDGRAAALGIDATLVTARLASAGVYRYSAFVTLRETGGAGATLSTVTVAVVNASGGTSTADIPAATAFGVTRIGGRGTLVSSALAASGALGSASSFVVRIGFRDDRGTSGTAERSTPVTLDVTGTWSGALPIRTPAGDWSLGRAALVQQGASITGELVSRDDARYPLSGSVLPGGVLLEVGGLPGDSICSAVTLAVTQFDFGGRGAERVSGNALGRCFGTVAGQFQLERS